ncbi:MAG: aminopeptidase C [Candidatus Xenobiia bacterium LiM19]
MKTLHHLFIALVMIVAVTLASQAAAEEIKSIKPLYISPEGAITSELRTRLENTIPADSQTRARINAVTPNIINTLVINREMVNKHTNLFSHKIESGKITNQKVSGRCWLFASLNMLRQPMLKKFNVSDFEFSENYLTFWDKMEKANFFLEAIIATSSRNIMDKTVTQLLKEPFEDGGQWNYTVALVKKYGVIPKSAMDESYQSSNTAIMDKIMSSLLRKDAAILRKMHKEGRSDKDQRKKKEAMLVEVYRILVYCLGTPPERFEWRFEDKNKKVSTPKTYTPQEFYKDVVGSVLDDFVFFYSSPTWPFNRLYQIDLDRDMVEAKSMTFINVKMPEMKEIAQKSIQGGDLVLFSCDSGKDMEKETGIMSCGIYDYESLFNIDLSMTKQDRVLYRNSTPSHAMVLSGIDIVDGKVRKWLVENSWSKERGNDGYFSMYDSWFDEYVYSIIANKKYVSPATLELLKTEPVVLPEDDPLREYLRLW